MRKQLGRCSPYRPMWNTSLGSYRVEYSTSPFYEEVQALTISCQPQQEVQVVTTTADPIPEEQLVHLKMADNFDAEFSAATDEIQV